MLREQREVEIMPRFVVEYLAYEEVDAEDDVEAHKKARAILTHQPDLIDFKVTISNKMALKAHQEEQEALK